MTTSITVLDCRGGEALAIQGSPPSLTSGDVATIKPARHLVVRIGNSANITNITLHGVGVVPDKVYAEVASNKTVWLKIANTSAYQQSDGNIHISADQDLSSVIAVRL